LSAPDLDGEESDVVRPAAEEARDGLLADIETASDHRLVWTGLTVE